MAIVREIRPLLGLAYLEDDGGHEWTVTRSTEGLDLASVATGQQFELMIERFRGAAFVRACRSSS